MKTVSTGLGLCVLGIGIASYPVLDHLMPRADAGAPHGASAVVASAAAQVEPTIVWYQAVGPATDAGVFRAWSDGRIEFLKGAWSYQNNCYGFNVWNGCDNTPWHVVSTPSAGFTYRSDINFDSKVDGADLGTLLADWGAAPRRDIPSSDCPLNLINP